MKTRWDEAAIFRAPIRRPLAQAIADQIRRSIVRGELAQGRRLPAVHRLAKLHGVSVPTAHAAVQILVALGFVRVSPGVGTFVRRAGMDVAAVNHGWMHATPTELAHMRAVMDQHLAVLVAREAAAAGTQRPNPMLSEIAILANERAIVRDEWPEQFLARDASFHASVARSVPGLEVTAAIHEAISQRLRHYLIPVAGQMAANSDLADLHPLLASAILDGRPVAAGRIARTIAESELAIATRSLG